MPMQLSMTVLRCPDQVAPETRTVAGGEFHVGRGPDVDWVLPDPDRLLSKRHFAVAFRGGGWQIADTSTNGTWLNAEEDSIGRGATRSLRDGDRLRLGLYEIEVRLVEQPVHTAGGGGFGAGVGGGGQGAARGPFGDPFADDPLAPPPAAHVPFNERAWPDAGMAPTGARLPHDFDPLAPDHGEPFGDEPFGGFQGPVQADHSPSMEDAMVPPGIAGYAAAQSGGLIPGDDLLPDDWDKDLLEGIMPPSPQTPAPHAASAASPGPPVEPFDFDDPLGPIVPAETEWTAPEAEPMPPAPAAFAPAQSSVVEAGPVGAAPVVRQRPPRQAPPSSSPPAAVAPVKAPGMRPASAAADAPFPAEPAAASPFDEPVQPAEAAARQPVQTPGREQSDAAQTDGGASEASATDAAALAAFFAGAELSDAAPADPIGMMNGLGQAFRALVAGLRQVLIARATIKGEFRIEQTMIRARGNNPLKFSANDDDALTALLGVGRRTDMTPAAAIEDSLRDLRMHELATMAAMQVAVRAMLDELSPDKIRAGADQGGMAVLPAQRKARAWDAFEARHAAVVQALVDDFDSIFGKSFARAYERALDETATRERQ
jgi:type VI secretion system FHA domain protein